MNGENMFETLIDTNDFIFKPGTKRFKFYLEYLTELYKDVEISEKIQNSELFKKISNSELIIMKNDLEPEDSQLFTFISKKGIFFIPIIEINDEVIIDNFFFKRNQRKWEEIEFDEIQKIETSKSKLWIDEIKLRLKNKKEITIKSQYIFNQNTTNYTIEKIYTELANYIDSIVKIQIEKSKKMEKKSTELAKFEKMYSQLDSLIEEKQWEKGLEIADNLLEVYEDIEESFGLIHILKNKSLCFLYLNKLNQALNEINRAFELFEMDVDDLDEDDSQLYYELSYLKGFILFRKEKYEESLFYLKAALKNCNDIEIIEDITDNIFECTSKYLVDDLLQKDYYSRKLIYIEDDFILYKPEKMNTINIKYIKDQLKFPGGAPVPGELYIGHPYIPEVYFPIEDYETFLFESKVNEASRIFQALGAKSIQIEKSQSESTHNYSNKKNSTDKETNVEVGGGFKNKVVNVEENVGVNNRKNQSSERNDENYELNAIAMKCSSINNPKYKPFLPEGLIWYYNENTWESIVRERMDGNLIKKDVVISTSSLKQIKENEISDIAKDLSVIASVKGGNLLVKGNLDVKVENKSKITEELTKKLSKKESSEWIMHIEFAPIEELTENHVTHELLDLNKTPKKLKEDKSNLINDDEQDYIEFFKEILEIEDDEINEKERKLLERRREKLGISNERANELEQNVSNEKFTDAELKYIAEVEFSLEDDGKIDDSERKLLNRKLEKFEILPERANELEKFVQKKINKK